MSTGQGSPLEQARRALAQGALKRAEDLLKQVGSLSDEALDSTMDDLMRLAEAWADSGKTLRAARLYEEIVHSIERLRGQDVADLVEPLRRQANVLLETDLPHEQSCVPAEDALRRALRLQERHFGRDTAAAGWMLLDLGDLVHDHERCEDAEELGRRAWDIGRAVGREDPALFLEATNWLAGWYEGHQEWRAGRRMLESSLELASQLIGPGQPRLAGMMDGLATMILEDTGDAAAADALCARALDILTVAYGELPMPNTVLPRPLDDLATVRLMFSTLYSTRAHAAFLEGNLSGCGYLLNRALLMLDLPDGEVSPDVASAHAASVAEALEAHARLATEQGDEVTAERFFKQALTQSEAAEPDQAANIFEDYASWLEDRGRGSEADQARRQAENLRNS
ncbi:MAG: hypothetical protein JO247_08450 [Chloroflexi bacterium]|nr:hypothetical protein [Chloroflexota bacterium]